MSFWLVMSLAVGLLIAILLNVLSSRYWLTLGSMAVLLLAVPGLVKPEMVLLPYKIWNKLATIFAKSARFYLMAVCFYIVFTAVGRTGSSLRLSQAEGEDSMWTPWEAGSYRRAQGVVLDGSTQKTWIPSVVEWTKPSNWWVCCLLPFLFLISALDSQEEETGIVTSIYTLY